MNTLYLASTSRSRQMLLNEAKIPFIVIGHEADEEAVDRSLPFAELLQAIARAKMDHAIVPPPEPGLPYEATQRGVVWVVSADSMGVDANRVIHGKPKDRDDAINKIRAGQGVGTHGTAYCLDKKQWDGHQWQLVERIERVVKTRYCFRVPEQWIDRYLEHSWAMIASGAIAIELYGAQFLEWIEGSYSSVVGLPMFELREDLERLKFFD